MLRTWTCIAASLAGFLVAAIDSARACTNAEIAAVIDATGERLRVLSTQAKSAMDEKVRTLGKTHGWAENEAESRAWEYLADGKGVRLDEQAAGLLMKLDQLGDESRGGLDACERLAAAKATAKELVDASEAKTRYLAQRLDAALREGMAKPKAARADRPRQPPAPRPTPMPWSTTAVREVPVPPHKPAPALPVETGLSVSPPDPTFSADEIAAAGRGVFGTISSNIAAVIQYAIDQYGRPTGYILGSEGSGALIAGLRYGSGHLVMRDGSATPVYWQGPSFGYDVGVTGSRVMFLVYSVRQPDDVYRRFAGIDGSAYVVGGAGITFLKRGPVILAPIRTGLGLRIGANVGYLKFTPRPSYNPF